LNTEDHGRSAELLPHGRYLDARISVINPDRGKLGGRFFILRDVTEMVHASNALGQANEQLRGQLAEIERMQVLLYEQALRDSLTGMYNRRYMDEMPEREFQYAKRTNGMVTLAFLDIDHFKNVNDAHGHLAGEEILKGLGKILAETSRSTDVACRYGGEEFIVVLKETSIAVASQRVEEWRRRFSAILSVFRRRALVSLFPLELHHFPMAPRIRIS
jgi:diguanylate cyclase (GGDEF)-like protein